MLLIGVQQAEGTDELPAFGSIEVSASVGFKERGRELQCREDAVIRTHYFVPCSKSLGERCKIRPASSS